ncbi:hypothetical protein HMPREF1624_07709 [Sporothrix schenckii ATCC 58251]|uniref:Fe2OG dioxygenase domain-containing protein n=1 Tax=Sporothrix schenckii (strain ATCC 58251 / de Perez 2211183) TaxID=1391915 RepID=U7PKJ3_SPOS1|nr:hypothetical protein HMPREF1624_07709 [Sporothrix schenckii ATCC 58251]
MAATAAKYNPFAGFTDNEDEAIATGIGARKVVAGDIPPITQIPVVDLAGAFSDDIAARRKVAAEVYTACSQIGFFYIKNHGVDLDLIAKCQKAGLCFFQDQTHEQKMELSMSRNPTEYFGYAPKAGTMPDGAIKRRMYETIHWGYEAELDPEATGPWDSSYNFYPPDDTIPGFRDLMREYYGAIMVLARRLLKILALGLQLDEDYFDQFTKHPNVMLALNYYEAAAPQNPEGSGIFAHSDLEVFTILCQDEVKSLEVLSNTGKWLPANPIPGHFVVNVGDTLSMWTNGLLQSTIHRAYNIEGKTRLSMPFFFGADNEAVIEAFPSCVTADNPARFNPIQIGSYHKERIHLQYPEGKAVAPKAVVIKSG